VKLLYKDSLAYKIWIIIYPVIIHYMALSVCALLTADTGVLATALAGFITLPIFVILFYKDKKELHFSLKSDNIKLYDMLLVIVAGIAACLGFNFLIALIQLNMPSNDYDAIAEIIFSSHLLFQLIGVGIIAPITEEFIFRGLIFNRLKRFIKPTPAIVVSALIFGIYHWNLTQGIYAFILGLILAFLYEKYDMILVPVLFHITANITSLIVRQMNLKIDVMMLIISTILCLTVLIVILNLVNKKK